MALKEGMAISGILALMELIGITVLMVAVELFGDS